MACLLYGVTKIESEVLRVAASVCDEAVLSSEMDDVRVYWSAIDKPETCLGDAELLKKAALQFHQVTREILREVTLIPFRFPTLLDNPEAIPAQLAEERLMYRAALDRIGDAVQYEVVATWSNEQPAPDPAATMSGREYLARRQAAMVRLGALDEKLRSVTAGIVQDWRTRHNGRANRWFALVPRGRREDFIAALKTAGGTQDVRLRLTGPWPPAEFVTS